MTPLCRNTTHDLRRRIDWPSRRGRYMGATPTRGKRRRSAAIGHHAGPVARRQGIGLPKRRSSVHPLWLIGQRGRRLPYSARSPLGQKEPAVIGFAGCPEATRQVWRPTLVVFRARLCPVRPAILPVANPASRHTPAGGQVPVGGVSARRPRTPSQSARHQQDRARLPFVVESMGVIVSGRKWRRPSCSSSCSARIMPMRWIGSPRRPLLRADRGTKSWGRVSTEISTVHLAPVAIPIAVRQSGASGDPGEAALGWSDGPCSVGTYARRTTIWSSDRVLRPC